MKTQAIPIRERKEGDVYIGRAGRGSDGYFGNPFPLGRGVTRSSSISSYRTYFLKRVEEDAQFKARVLALKGKRLVCFCKPHACHGDVIAMWVDAQGGE